MHVACAVVAVDKCHGPTHVESRLAGALEGELNRLAPVFAQVAQGEYGPAARTAHGAHSAGGAPVLVEHRHEVYLHGQDARKRAQDGRGAEDVARDGLRVVGEDFRSRNLTVRVGGEGHGCMRGGGVTREGRLARGLGGRDACGGRLLRRAGLSDGRGYRGRLLGHLGGRGLISCRSGKSCLGERDLSGC